MSDAKGQQIADDEYRGFAPPIGVLPDAPVEFAPLIPNQQQQQQSPPIPNQQQQQQSPPIPNQQQQQQQPAGLGRQNQVQHQPESVIRPQPVPDRPPSNLYEANQEINRLRDLLKAAEDKLTAANQALTMEQLRSERLLEEKHNLAAEVKRMQSEPSRRNDTTAALESKLTSAQEEIRRLKDEADRRPSSSIGSSVYENIAGRAKNNEEWKEIVRALEKKLTEADEKCTEVERSKRDDLDKMQEELTKTRKKLNADIEELKADYARKAEQHATTLDTVKDDDEYKLDQQKAKTADAQEDAKKNKELAMANARRNEKDYVARARATESEIKEKAKGLKARVQEVRDHQLDVIDHETKLKLTYTEKKSLAEDTVKRVAEKRKHAVNMRWDNYIASIIKWADVSKFILFGDPGPIPPPPPPPDDDEPKGEKLQMDMFFQAVSVIASWFAIYFGRPAEIPSISLIGNDYEGVIKLLEYSQRKLAVEPNQAIRTLLDNNQLEATAIIEIIKFFTEPAVPSIQPEFRTARMIEQMRSIQTLRTQQMEISGKSVLLMQDLINWFVTSVRRHEVSFSTYCERLVEKVREGQHLPDYSPNVSGLGRTEIKINRVKDSVLADGLFDFLAQLKRAHIFDTHQATFQDWFKSANELVLTMKKGEFTKVDAITVDFNTSTTNGIVAFTKAMDKAIVQFEKTFEKTVTGITDRFDTRVVSHFADAVTGIPVKDQDSLHRVNVVFNQVLAAFDDAKNVPPLVRKVEKLSLEIQTMSKEVNESKKFSGSVFALIPRLSGLNEITDDIPLPPELKDEKDKTASYDALLVYIRQVFDRFAVNHKLLKQALLHVTDFKARKQLSEMLATARSVDDIKDIDKSEGGLSMPVLEAGAASHHPGVSNLTMLNIGRTKMAAMVPRADVEEYKTYGMLINFTKLVAGKLSRSVDTLLIPLIPNVETDSATFKFIVREINETINVPTNAHHRVTTGKSHHLRSGFDRSQDVDDVIADNLVKKMALLLPEQKEAMVKASKELRKFQLDVAVSSLREFNKAVAHEPMENALAPFLVPTFLTELMSAYHMMKTAFPGCLLHELLVCPPVNLVFAQLLATNIAMSETFINSNESYDKDRYLQLQAQQEAITTTIRRQVRRLGAYNWS